MPLYNASLQSLDCAEIRRYAGLRTADFPESLIEAACKEAKVLSRAQISWQRYPYDPRAGAVQTAPPFCLTGETIRRHLRACRQVILLAATVGEDIDKEISAQFSQGNYTKALLLDAAATTAVEAAIDQLETSLRPQFAKEGRRFLRRFSPGYGDWDIRAQPEMLAWSQAQQIGVSLTEACMLLPRKSVTAIIGLTDAAASADAAGCKHCSQIHCIARKENETK